MNRPVTAKYATRCLACDTRFTPDEDLIVYCDDEAGWIHVECDEDGCAWEDVER